MCHQRGTLTRKLFNDPSMLASIQEQQKDLRTSTGEKHPKPAFTHCPRMPQYEEINEWLG